MIFRPELMSLFSRLPCRFLSLGLIGLWLILNAWPASAVLQVERGMQFLEPVGELSVLEDPAGQLGFAEVSERDTTAFRPLQGAIASFGFTASAYWLRLTLKNRSSSQIDSLLAIRTPWLDSLHIFVRQPDGRLIERQLGDQQVFAERDYPHPHFIVPLSLPPGEAVVHVRVASAQALLVPLEIWSPRAFHEHERGWSAYFGMFYGILLVMVLYNGFIWFSTHDRNYLNYCLYLITFFVMNFSYNGFAFQYVWPDSPRWLNWSYSIWIFCFQLMALRFTMGFLDSARQLPREHRLLQAAVGLIVLVWVLSAASGHLVAYNAAAVYSPFLVLPLMLYVALLAFRAGFAATRFFVLASAISLIGVLITVMTAIGAIPYSFAAFHAAEFGIIANVVLLGLALAERINFLRVQKDAAERAVLEQKLRASVFLEKAKQDLERMVLARTAELAKARDEAERLARVDVLSGMSNRRYFEEVATLEFSRAIRYKQPLSLILFDIDRFKSINDHCGHAIGDQAIRLVAQVARDGVREVDFIARIGGEEFIVLMPGTAMQQALLTAERLREQIAAQSIACREGTLSMTASFGVADIRSDDANYDAVLQRADKAMYSAKEGGRNRVCAAL